MISIFTRSSYIGNKHPAFTKESVLLRVSARVRGEEMAEHLGAKLNPTSGYENDVCIYVKPKSLDIIIDGGYLDYLDGKNVHLILKDYPKVRLIAACLTSYEWIKENLNNEVFLVPCHHINTERHVNVRTDTTKPLVAGYIGSASPEAFTMYKEIGDRLAEIGIEFKTCFNFKLREDAVALYKSIDLFIVGPVSRDDGPHKIPTKLINAASFGIPSIAYPLVGYKEIEGFYTQARTIDEIVSEAKKFKDEDYYNQKASRLLSMAEQYHISNIIKYYQALEPSNV